MLDTIQYDPNDPLFVKCLDHGFVYLVDHMGDDTSLVQAARVSYGAGTRSVREDRGLIRYLFRHAHSSPVEMAEVKFHIKLPIFVMRQLIRHRTASCNEYSARYSIMHDEFYIPDTTVIQPQSDDNKQGRGGDMSDKNKRGVQWMFTALYETAYDCYQALLGERDKTKFIQGDIPYGAYDEDDSIFDGEFTGTARELSRSVLPVGNYTEAYWKIDLSNLLKMLKLRMDAHAQYEIRVYAEAMYKLIQPIFPLACEAAEDYLFQARNLSRMEVSLVRDCFQRREGFMGLLEDFDHDDGALGKHYGLSKREITEFREGFGI
jgi:thymidylate synthase (FAD)